MTCWFAKLFFAHEYNSAVVSLYTCSAAAFLQLYASAIFRVALAVAFIGWSTEASRSVLSHLCAITFTGDGPVAMAIRSCWVTAPN